MPRKPGSRARASGTALVPYTFGDRAVPQVAIYRAPDRHPHLPGPWQAEPEKLAWRDQATGLGCIIRRESQGHLGGYVGISADHPLFGFDWTVVPAGLGIIVHGGLSYADVCNDDEPESVSICHVAPPLDAVSGTRLDALAPIWWFGFTCDESYDLVPGRADRDSRSDDRQIYRDQDYVYRQVVQLAAQLHAIGAGLPRPPIVSPPPPRGLDPSATEDR
jgi:hypothetical protein